MSEIKKPQSAFQYYLKAWKDLPEEMKTYFIELAEEDKERYEQEVKEKKLAEEKEVKKLQIYLRAYTGGYSAVGLDNGAKSFETVGPVVKIIEYSEEEQKKWGVKVKEFKYLTGSHGGGDYSYRYQISLHHNEKYYKHSQFGDPDRKGDNVYTHCKTYNHRKDNPYAPIRKYNICKTPPKHVGTTTNHYTSFDNTTWTTTY